MNISAEMKNSSMIGMDMFNRLMKVANPDLEDPTVKLEVDEQLLVSKFTRIFNLKQLLYILPTHKPDIPNLKKMICKIKTNTEVLMTEFLNEYHNPKYLDNMSIYDLMGCEIDEDIINDKDAPLDIKIHKIAIMAFQIEKGFQFRKWDFKMATMNLAESIVNRKYAEKVALGKELWNRFEKDYIEYVNRLERKGKEEVLDFYSIVQKKEIDTISYTNSVISDTINFVTYMNTEDGKKKTASRVFHRLFDQYKKTSDCFNAETSLLSGYIQHFRLANISKILFLIDEYGIECDYAGIDMGKVIGEKLFASQDSVPNLLAVNIDTMIPILIKDGIKLTGKENVLENFDDLLFLFCCYLDLENEWYSFTKWRIYSMAKTPYEKFISRKLMAPAVLIDGYFEEIKERAKYDEVLNKINGKIIDFPGMR